ncbi:MAG: PadR family transcriptional regulator [Anaerolineae bacterium]
MSVRYAILGLLAQQPHHGYALHAKLQALVGGAENWGLKPAQVYNTLTRLAEAGLVCEEAVEKEGGPEKHIFAITPAGQAELLSWLQSGEMQPTIHDDIFLKCVLALSSDEELTRRILQTQRAVLYRELHRVTTQRAQADPARELVVILLHDKTIMHLEADLRWLDMLEARLDEVRRQPLPEPPMRRRGRPRKGFLPIPDSTSKERAP